MKIFFLILLLVFSLNLHAQIGPDGTGTVNGYIIGPGVGLTGANLNGADLSGAILRDSDLTYAILTGAVISNTTIFQVS
mgnify:CR=1 FL=1